MLGFTVKTPLSKGLIQKVGWREIVSNSWAKLEPINETAFFELAYLEDPNYNICFTFQL